jgi:hypothetical protein
MVKFSEVLDSVDSVGNIDLSPPSPPLISNKNWNWLWGYVTPVTEKIASIAETISHFASEMLSTVKEMGGYAVEGGFNTVKEGLLLTSPSAITYLTIEYAKYYFEDVALVRICIGAGLTGGGIYLLYYNYKQLKVLSKEENAVSNNEQKKKISRKKVVKRIEHSSLVTEPEWILLIQKIKILGNFFMAAGGVLLFFSGLHAMNSRRYPDVCMDDLKLERTIIHEIKTCRKAKNLWEKALKLTNGTLTIQFNHVNPDLQMGSISKRLVCLYSDPSDEFNKMEVVGKTLSGLTDIVFQGNFTQVNQTALSGLSENKYVYQYSRQIYYQKLEQTLTLLKCIRTAGWDPGYVKMTAITQFAEFYSHFEPEIKYNVTKRYNPPKRV